jgi:hypothetical protein
VMTVWERVPQVIVGEWFARSRHPLREGSESRGFPSRGRSRWLARACPRLTFFAEHSGGAVATAAAAPSH